MIPSRLLMVHMHRIQGKGQNRIILYLLNNERAGYGQVDRLKRLVNPIIYVHVRFKSCELAISNRSNFFRKSALLSAICGLS